MDRDLRAIAAKGFMEFFKEVEEAELSDTFWEVGLVQNLETSAISSPYFNTFIAAQVHGNDRSLLSNSAKVADLLSAGDVHHIFPKEFLKKNGIDDKSMYNQVANYAYLDTGVNISIGKQAPQDYFTAALNQCATKELKVGTITENTALRDNLTVNCIPSDIFTMTAADYEKFLKERRILMAKKIKEYYNNL
jgi:hypothetical protein